MPVFLNLDISSTAMLQLPMQMCYHSLSHPYDKYPIFIIHVYTLFLFSQTIFLNFTSFHLIFFSLCLVHYLINRSYIDKYYELLLHLLIFFILIIWLSFSYRLYYLFFDSLFSSMVFIVIDIINLNIIILVCL